MRTVVPDLGLRGFDFIASSVHGERWGLPSLSGYDSGAIEETLEAVGARELAARPLSDMSGGERQRLLLAQALIGQFAANLKAQLAAVPVQAAPDETPAKQQSPLPQPAQAISGFALVLLVLKSFFRRLFGGK